MYNVLFGTPQGLFRAPRLEERLENAFENTDPNQLRCTVSSKKQKVSSKKSSRMEEPMEDYDREKFVIVGASEKFTLISKNRSFIKEKGFHHPEDS